MAIVPTTTVHGKSAKDHKPQGAILRTQASERFKAAQPCPCGQGSVARFRAVVTMSGTASDVPQLAKYAPIMANHRTPYLTEPRETRLPRRGAH